MDTPEGIALEESRYRDVLPTLWTECSPAGRGLPRLPGATKTPYKSTQTNQKERIHGRISLAPKTAQKDDEERVNMSSQETPGMGIGQMYQILESISYLVSSVTLLQVQ